MQTDPKNPKSRLTKSNDRWLAGVCGGVAEFLGWSPKSIRVLWITVTILTAVIPAVIAYTLMAVIMPPPRQPFDINTLRKQ